jgi:hypothetical protein
VKISKRFCQKLVLGSQEAVPQLTENCYMVLAMPSLAKKGFELFKGIMAKTYDFSQNSQVAFPGCL